jgi:hypothetical protein
MKITFLHDLPEVMEPFSRIKQFRDIFLITKFGKTTGGLNASVGSPSHKSIPRVLGLKPFTTAQVSPCTN